MQVKLKKEILTAAKWDGTEEGYKKFTEAFQEVRTVRHNGDLTSTDPLLPVDIYALNGARLITLQLSTEITYVEDPLYGILGYTEGEFAALYDVMEEPKKKTTKKEAV